MHHLHHAPKFLSTLSLRRATKPIGSFQHCFLISIHALLAESDPKWMRVDFLTVEISIHALLAESDEVEPVLRQLGGISIHALLAESDLGKSGSTVSDTLFLSTLSLRRATSCTTAPKPCRSNFYPRSPCGERRGVFLFIFQLLNFYPRSPCGERHDGGQGVNGCCDFYPRSPCGERHPQCVQ